MKVLQNYKSRQNERNPDKLKLVNYNRKICISKIFKCKILVGKILMIQHPFIKFVRLFHRQSFVLYGMCSLSPGAWPAALRLWAHISGKSLMPYITTITYTVGSISCHITSLVINSLGVDTYIHAHIPTCKTMVILKNQTCVGF